MKACSNSCGFGRVPKKRFSIGLKKRRVLNHDVSPLELDMALESSSPYSPSYDNKLTFFDEKPIPMTKPRPTIKYTKKKSGYGSKRKKQLSLKKFKLIM